MKETNDPNELPPALLKAMVIIIVPLVLLVAWYIYKEPNRTLKEDILFKATSEQFAGKVISVYRQINNHNIQTAKLSNGYLYELWPEWENKINVGDSLLKKKDELKVMVIKSTGQIMILDYRELVKNDK